MPPKKKTTKRLASTAAQTSKRPQRKVHAPKRLVVEDDGSNHPSPVVAQQHDDPTSSVIGTRPTANQDPGGSHIRNVVQQEISSLQQSLASSIQSLVSSAVSQAMANFIPASSAPLQSVPQQVVGPAVTSIMPGNNLAPPIISSTVTVATTSNNPAVLKSASHDALQARVPQKLKDKIWANEYIDLSVLLDPDAEPEYQLSFTPSTQGTAGVDMVPKNKKTIYNMAQWDQAFTTYVAVYTEKHPELISQLLQYAQQVKQMCHSGGAWKAYDETFRKHRAARLIPWSSTLMDKWLECSNRSTMNSGRNNAPRPRQNFRQQRQGGNQSFRKYFYRKGICFRYNDGETCHTPCKYKHVCANCDGPHPVFECRAPPPPN